MPAEPPIAATIGEPAGIGPDLLVQLAQSDAMRRLLVVGDPVLLAARAQELGVPLRIREAQASSFPEDLASSEMAVLPMRFPEPIACGEPCVGNVRTVLETLDAACDLCMSGQACAMVTPPLHKGIINQAGVSFTGHTEYLATRCGGVHPVMLLACPGLRVALHTTHLPLAEVPAALTPEGLERTLRIVHRDARRLFALSSPRILVCGLNPHAGEQGCFGREEIDIMQPALDRLRGEGMDLDGPAPADTAFLPNARSRYDLFVCMYHDQGLPALKALGFGQAVNITLGLPIVRVSVDHGTAFPLAGTGRADASSLGAAIATAAELAANLRAAPAGSHA